MAQKVVECSLGILTYSIRLKKENISIYYFLHVFYCPLHRFLNYFLHIFTFFLLHTYFLHIFTSLSLFVTVLFSTINFITTEERSKRRAILSLVVIVKT